MKFGRLNGAMFPVVTLALLILSVRIDGFALRLFDPQSLSKATSEINLPSHVETGQYQSLPVPARKMFKLGAPAFNGFRPTFMPTNKQFLDCKGYDACKEKLIKFLSINMNHKRMAMLQPDSQLTYARS